MQGPSGESGVQRFPKRRQSAGPMTPLRTSPQRQPGASLTARPVSSPYLTSASTAEYEGRSLRPLAGILPSPRQTASLASSVSSIRARATGFPSGSDDPRVDVGHPGLPLPDLIEDRQDPGKDLHGLESGDRPGNAELIRDEGIGGFADDGGDVAGIEEARDGAFPRFEDRADRGRDEPQGREHGVVPEVLLEGPAGRVGDAGDRCFKARAEEDDVLFRGPSGGVQGLLGGIDHADERAAGGDRLPQGAPPGRDAGHVPESGQNEVLPAGHEVDGGLVDRVRGDADGTPGARDHPDARLL